VPGDAHAFGKELAAYNIICSDRGTYLRVAPHFYNTDDDMQLAADRISELANDAR